MDALSGNGCRSLLTAIEAVHGINSIKEFPASVLLIIRTMLPCNTMCYNEVALPGSLKSWVMEPADAMPGPLLKESFMRNFSQHPGFIHYVRTGDSGSYRMSDFLSRRQFHDSALYNEYYRQSGVEFQLATAFMLVPDLMVAIALDRHCTDFSDDELLALNLFRPHLLQAYHNIQALELIKRVVDTSGKSFMVVSRSGQVMLTGDSAWRLISGYCRVSPFQAVLPDTLRNWVAHQIDRFSDENDVPSTPAPLIINSQDGCRLKVCFLWGGKTSGQDMLLIEEELPEIASGLLENNTLTDREKEILSRVSRGETNSEIGRALSVSPLTVKKHLENIYGKLRVHRRTAAVARFLRL